MDDAEMDQSNLLKKIQQIFIPNLVQEQWEVKIKNTY